MIKAPHKIHKIQLMLMGFKESSYHRYIVDQHYCIYCFRFSDKMARGLSNSPIEIPENLGKLQKHDQNTT